MRDLKDFELLLYSRFDRIKYKTNAFAKCLMEAVDAGILPVGFVLPSVEQLADLTRLSISTINRAFDIMVAKGYLTKENGVCHVIRDPKSPSPGPVKNKAAEFFLNNVCIKPLNLTYRLHKLFLKYFNKHYADTPSYLQNTIFNPLILTLCGLLNLRHDTAYMIANVYYMHDYQSLIKTIGLVFFGMGEGIIIPKVLDCRVRLGLRASMVKTYEVNTRAGVVDLVQLEKFFSRGKGKVLYLMPDLNYPDLLNMSREHLIKIINLVKMYDKYLIIDDRMRPWLVDEGNLTLGLSKYIRDKIIYISPVSYLYEELHRINMVAASAEFIAKLRTVAIEQGKHAYYSKAFAVNVLLKHIEFTNTVKHTDNAVKLLMDIILKVFSTSGRWNVDGLRLGIGPVAYIVPKVGSFKESSYEYLEEKGIYMVDPANYNTKKKEILGFRMELAMHLDRQNMLGHIIELEKELTKLLF